jgi:acetate kinase
MSGKQAVLTLNAGSSSIKFSLYEIGAILDDYRWAIGSQLDHEALLKPLLGWVTTHLGEDALAVVGHRVVHGGQYYDRPVLISSDVLATLEKLVPLAPLHQPHNLAAIKAIARLRSGLPQVACFDTAFHHGMPVVATGLALPRSYTDEGVRRYGFHGLSYEYVIGRLRELMPCLASGRVIVAHLGNGASLCAMKDGHSVDTTMGFTTLDGLMMGTRCGALDPGAVLYLQQAHGLSAAEVERVLYYESGLLGVSGISSDMRALLASADLRAKQAIELFVFRIAREIGAMVSSLGGIDALVFTAGIGEHAAPIRAAVCARLGWLGVECDEAANQQHRPLISSHHSTVRVCVIATDEEDKIAEHSIRLLKGTGDSNHPASVDAPVCSPSYQPGKISYDLHAL